MTCACVLLRSEDSTDLVRAFSWSRTWIVQEPACLFLLMGVSWSEIENIHSSKGLDHEWWNLDLMFVFGCPYHSLNHLILQRNKQNSSKYPRSTHVCKHFLPRRAQVWFNPNVIRAQREMIPSGDIYLSLHTKYRIWNLEWLSIASYLLIAALP